MKSLGVLLLLLWSVSALAKGCGEAGAKHWTTIVKTAAAPVTLHWTGVYEGQDSVCAIAFSRPPGHVQMLSVWGQPQVNTAQSLIAFSSCADDGCDRAILVADIVQGAVQRGMLPLPDQQLYFSVAWKGSERTLAVEVEGIQGQPPQHLTCSVSERVVCANPVKAASTAIPNEIASWLESYAASRKMFDGGVVPYPQSSTFVEGRLGATPSGVLLFTLEGIRGGTDYLQYLAVFRKRGDQYVFCCLRRVGGKGIGSIENVTFSGNTLEVSGKKFVSGVDAMCCPSKPFVEDIGVQGSQLVEARASK